MDQNYPAFRINAIKEETPAARTFTLEALDGGAIEYQAGQFITLVFKTPHGEKRRSYSISSAPFENKLCITVKRITNGEFSRPLIENTKVGDLLYSAGIGGHFTLPEQAANQYFFLAAGSGITPCFSLIKDLLKNSSAKINLIYSNRSEPDTIFFQELNILQILNPLRFKIRYLFSDRTSVYEKRLSHWLFQQFLEQDLEVPSRAAYFFLCGPFEYMQMAEITIRSRVPAENICKENFDHWTKRKIPEPPDRESHEVLLHFKGEQFRFKTQYPFSILQTAKKLQIPLPYSCEAGRCSACVGTCKSGKIWMAYNEVLTDKEVAAGRILVCQSFAQDGPVEIEVT